jgi:hypothetical protein
MTDWSLGISIFAGFLTVALAIGFGLGRKVNDFLNETRRGTVDEKIAMLYGYASDVKKWNVSDVDTRFKIERIKSDIRSIGRMKKAIQQGQKEDLIKAKDQLIEEMKRNKLDTEAHDIDTVYIGWVS